MPTASLAAAKSGVGHAAGSQVGRRAGRVGQGVKVGQHVAPAEMFD